MKIKELIKEKGYNISQISKKTDIPYSTLNDIINGKVDINNVAFGKCKAICDVLDISLDEFICLFNNRMSISKDAHVIIKNHTYFLRYNGIDTPLVKVNKFNKQYINELASWEYTDIKEKEYLDRLTKELIPNAT